MQYSADNIYGGECQAISDIDFNRSLGSCNFVRIANESTSITSFVREFKRTGLIARFKTRSNVSKSTYLVRWIAENVFAVITFIGTFPNRSCTLVDLEDSNSTNIITTSLCLSSTIKKANTLCRFLSLF